jgi:hypothetical protein
LDKLRAAKDLDGLFALQEERRRGKSRFGEKEDGGEPFSDEDVEKVLLEDDDDLFLDEEEGSEAETTAEELEEERRKNEELYLLYQAKLEALTLEEALVFGLFLRFWFIYSSLS